MVTSIAIKEPHIPVMCDEILAAIVPSADEIYVDGTFGAGGYSRALLAAAPCQVIALDRDPDAITAGETLSAANKGRLTLIRGRFGILDQLISEPETIDAVVLDIGVSSMQLDQANRGFSFQREGPLDMRMGQDCDGELCAADLVNGLNEADLTLLLRNLGEERQAKRVARAVILARMEAPITTTKMLVEIIEPLIRSEHRIHPATRCFQALRIAVNNELGELARGLAAAERVLKPGGRLVVVAFHSLEDRLVKQFLYARTGRETQGSRHRPDKRGHDLVEHRPSFHLPRRNVVRAGADEINGNPRARSARMRVAVRTNEPCWPDPLQTIPEEMIILSGVFSDTYKQAFDLKRALDSTQIFYTKSQPKSGTKRQKR